MLLGTFGLSLIVFVVWNVCQGQPNKGTLELDENLKLAWRINSTKGTIRFTVNSLIDEEAGWFLIGLAPQNNSTKISLNDITGYGCVIWKRNRTGKTDWQNTVSILTFYFTKIEFTSSASLTDPNQIINNIFHKFKL